MSSSARPLRILCLHGYRQNGDAFRKRTGAFRKLFKKQAEFVFMTAPLNVKPLPGSDNEDDGRGWWFSRSDEYFKAQDNSDCDQGFEESLSSIATAFVDNEPIDGILGFSQGAAMAAMLCALQKLNKLNYEFKFAIIIAGFKSRSSQHQYLYNEVINIPTLHVYGETDEVIEKPMSEELLTHFNNTTVIQHSGGHFIPATSAQKQQYNDFIQKMKELCLNI